MFITIVLFILGFAVLIKSADFLVEGASSIAKKYGISTLVIGLTIVAFGTSFPELIVSIMASSKGSVGIALGNVLGSNITNTLLFFGIAAMMKPLMVKSNTVNKEIPLSLLSVVALFLLVNDSLLNSLPESILTRSDGAILILFFTIFVYYTFGISKEKNGFLDSTGEKIEEYSYLKSIVMILGGIVGLYFGGRWIVDGGVAIANLIGLSETFIGLTIVAIGTSLPELVASAVAVRKGCVDMAVGNIVGTNVFNLLFVLGASSIVRPIPFTTELNIDIMILMGLTILLLFMLYFGKKNVIDRREGIVLASFYVFYLITLAARG